MNKPTTENITFRTYSTYKEAIARAAKKAGKEFSDYVRDIIVPHAYSELGERMPDYTPIVRGRGRGEYSDVREAAEALGIPLRDFEKRAASMFAKQMLEELERSKPRPSQRPHKR